MKLYVLSLFTLIIGCTSAQDETRAVVKARPELSTSKPISDREIIDSLNTLTDTTIFIGGYKLQFRQVDSVDIPPVYLDAKERQSIFDKHDNFYMAAKDLESYLSKSQGQYFHRSGSTLNLRLSNGKTVSLKNIDKEGDEAIYYNYQHYFKDIDRYLIRTQLYEGDFYILINRETGDRQDIIGAVYPNPAGKRVVAINEDMEAAYSFNGLQLLEINNGVIHIKFTIAGGDWGPVNLTWLDNTNLILKTREWQTNASANYNTKYYKLTLEK